MLKPYVWISGLLLILVLLSYTKSTEGAKKNMIIGFSGGSAGAVNGNIKQNGELPTNAEIKAAIEKAKIRLARHQQKIGNAKGTGTQLAAGGKTALRR